MSIEANKLVAFRLGEDLFAADIHSVERVLRYTSPTPVPDMPDYIEGVMDYQGRVVPIVNLRLRFELPAAAVANETRMLVLSVSGEWIGIVVDAVTEVASYDRAAMSPPPKLFRGLSAEYLKGIVRRGDRLVIFLDVDHLLASSERIALQEAGAKELAHG
jgi:purine-binding chemotaxis protein CheW